jgi:succinate dehydrogenase / fumarate reductase membrane anchor subunit
MHTKETSIRTPAARVRGLGSAKTGTSHFWLQRMTAVANIPLTIAFVAIVLVLARRDYAQAMALVSQPLVALLLIGFMLSAVIHMRLGMQVIIEDYVPEEGTKVVALIANTFFTGVIGIACVWAIAKVSFGL